MSDARWQRLQELFDGLIATPPVARAAWLAAADADDGLKREALALVEAENSGDGGMTGQLRQAAERMTSAHPIDQRIGAYRLVREIGSGGMGTVFLAERVDENFSQRVAIKLLRGIPTRESTERMRRERQILADLSHPHIARLLDGGNTRDGEPYLVMEYVDGVPLNAFCRAQALPLAARMRLLQKICGAVQFAHQRLVIHRDLKPANVLVRVDGEPVLLDFGIAKLLVDTDPSAQQTGLHWFTPAYASPEQKRGEAISTATDVYGLGLLLYEVLADAPPTRDEAGRLPLPSRSGSTAGRVPADLDLIVAKATHPEPERRYVSAAALADDLQRHLRGRPIHAAPDRLLYRTGKFVGRHRFASIAIVAALALATLFTWRLASERDRALRAEAQAREQSATAESVVDYLIAMFRSASPDDAGTRPIAPRDLVDRGRREIGTRLADAPRQRARLLGAFGEIYLELGVPDAAAESFASAAELARQHGTPRQQAAFLADQGNALNLGEDPGVAIPVLEHAVAMLGDVAPDERKLAAETLSTLGLAQLRIERIKEGGINIRRALDYAVQAEGEDSVIHAQCLYALAEADMRAGHLDTAEIHAKRSIGIMRKLLPEDSPEVIGAIGFLTQIYERQSRYAEGEELLRGMLATRLRTLDGSSAWAITVRNNLAQVIQLQGRTIEATALLRENVERLRAAGKQQSSSYTISLNNLASMLEDAGDNETSLGMFREVLAGVERRAAISEQPYVLTFRMNLGRSLMLNGKLDEARALLETPVEGTSLDLDIERGRQFAHMADWMRRSGRYAEALANIDRAATAFVPLYPAGHARFGIVARIRGLILRDLGQLEAAERELRQALSILVKGLGKDASTTIDTELQLADVLGRSGQTNEARVLLERLGPLLPSRFVEGSELLRQYAQLATQMNMPPLRRG
jgi:serine/threonine-protein kinase